MRKSKSHRDCGASVAEPQRLANNATNMAYDFSFELLYSNHSSMVLYKGFCSFARPIR